MADGSRKVFSGESVRPKGGMTVGVHLDPGEYSVRLRRKGRDGPSSGQFRISVKKAEE